MSTKKKNPISLADLASRVAKLEAATAKEVPRSVETGDVYRHKESGALYMVIWTRGSSRERNLICLTSGNDNHTVGLYWSSDPFDGTDPNFEFVASEFEVTI